jgi:four helix bundle protein
VTGGFIFEKLEVYQKALDFAEQVSKLTSVFLRPGWHLVDQFNRASLSVALNIAEGDGRRTGADRGRFFITARGSVHECIPLIEMCRRRDLLPPDVCAQLKREAEVLAKMLSGMIRRAFDNNSVGETGVGYGD